MTEQELFNEYRKSNCKSFSDFLINKIAELEKENADLEEQLESERDLSAIAYMQGAENQKKKDEENLEKAFKRIAELEEENAKLKTDYEVLSCSVGDFGELQDKLEEEQRKNNGLSDNLTKAKEIISEYVRLANLEKEDTVAIWQLYHKAEQFLKE